MTTQKLSRVHADSADSADMDTAPEYSTKTEATASMENDEGMEKIESKVVEAEEEVDRIEELRMSVKKFMQFSLFGRMYENALVTVAVFSGVQYISSTYSQYLEPNVVLAYQTIEITLAVIFSWDWLLCFCLADHKLLYFTDFYSMVDLLTVIPIWVTYGGYTCMDYNGIITDQDRIIYILCALSTTRILRSLRIRRKLMRISDEVTRCIADIALNIVVALIFFAALMQFLESQDQELEFHTWMYYILVTMATVGYGDIAPKSTLGRLLAMSMIAFAFIAGPQMSSSLLEKINEQSIYARAFYVKKYKATHVFVCGDISTMALLPFVNELFHEDHEDENINSVFMSPDMPNSTMRQILRDAVFSLRVTFLEGSALSEKDLKRAMVMEAKAIFIMTNKFSEDPDKEDAKTILQQFVLKKFVMREHSKEKPLFSLQLIRPENKRHLVDSSMVEGNNFKPDIILCLNEIKMGIIAKAVMFPGSNTLLMNLLTSFADDDDDDDEDEDDGKGENNETEDLDKDDQDNWVGEYQRGCGWEVYTTRLNPMFSGTMFAVLADILYQRIGVVLFGLLVEDLKKDRAHARMLLNPADYVIPLPSECYVEAFVIAENKNNSDLTFPDEGGEDDEGDGSSGGAIQMARAAAAMGLNFAYAHGAKAGKYAAEMAKGISGKGSGGGAGPDAPPPKKELEWQQLLRKYESKQTLSSQKEVEKRTDDEWMRLNYFTLLPLHASIESCTIHTSLEKEAPYVSQHTIIIGRNMNNLYDLIRPLRAMYLGYTRPIVILTPSAISASTWGRVSIFQGVFVIHGSGLEEQDLVRAGIFKASQCIFLADTEGMVDDTTLTAGAKATQSALLDADGVFAYQTITSMNPSISCCVEIINAANVGFLDPKEGLVSGDVDYKFTPQFASGALLTSSLLDTLICQAFYNRSIVAIIQLFAAGVDVKDKDTIRAQVLAGGNPNVVAEPKRGVSALVGSALYQMKIPEGEVRTYGEMFKSLCNDGILPLGLYRGVFKNMNVGPKQNKMPYVFTNPPKETELFSCDKVFVLSQKPIMGKRTVTKRTDWALLRGVTDDPVELLRLQLRSIEDGTKRKIDRVDEKIDDVLSALHEVAGKDKFLFEEAREHEELREYQRVRQAAEAGLSVVQARPGSPSRALSANKLV